jgi:hypothetical protein
MYIISSTYALDVAPGAGIQLSAHALERKGAGTATYLCSDCVARGRTQHPGLI